MLYSVFEIINYYLKFYKFFKNVVNKSYVLFFDYKNPVKSLKACVKQCPYEQINTEDQFKKYTKLNNLTLCLYNVKVGEYNSTWCPKLPIYKT
jgi:hypothetical protein